MAESIRTSTIPIPRCSRSMACRVMQLNLTSAPAPAFATITKAATPTTPALCLPPLAITLTFSWKLTEASATGHLPRRGLALADNAVYGFAATPRVSIAYYVRRPSSGSFFNGTKLRFNYGTGIDEPSIYNQGSSLFNLLSTLPNGPELISQYHVSPIGPERSRDFDWGVEQSLWGGRARLGSHRLSRELL